MIEVTGTNETYKLDVDTDMSLSDETINDDMCELPRKIAYYAEVAADLQAFAANQKNNLEVVEAQAAQEIRKDAAETGTKITENAIREQVVVRVEVSAARNSAYKAASQHTMIDGFYRGLREKASLAIAICYKQKEEIRVMSSSIN